MALKLKYKKKEDIPDGAQMFYVLKEDEYHLLVDDIPSADEIARISDLLTTERGVVTELKTKLGALGDTETGKISDLVELLGQLGDDFTTEKFGEMQNELKTLKSNRGTDAALLQDEIVQLKREKNQNLKEIKTIKKKFVDADDSRNALQGQINSTTIRAAIQTVAEKAKVLPEAIPDVLMYADSLFELDRTGQVVAKDGMQGILTGTLPEDWLVSNQPHKPHWWPRSSSGGGQGGGPGGYGGKNPWKPDSINLTEQGKLFRENQNLARSLAKEAGVDL